MPCLSSRMAKRSWLTFNEWSIFWCNVHQTATITMVGQGKFDNIEMKQKKMNLNASVDDLWQGCYDGTKDLILNQLVSFKATLNDPNNRVSPLTHIKVWVNSSWYHFDKSSQRNWKDHSCDHHYKILLGRLCSTTVRAQIWYGMVVGEGSCETFEAIFTQQMTGWQTFFYSGM